MRPVSNTVEYTFMRLYVRSQLKDREEDRELRPRHTHRRVQSR